MHTLTRAIGTRAHDTRAHAQAPTRRAPTRTPYAHPHAPACTSAAPACAPCAPVGVPMRPCACPIRRPGLKLSGGRCGGGGGWSNSRTWQELSEPRVPLASLLPNSRTWRELAIPCSRTSSFFPPQLAHLRSHQAPQRVLRPSCEPLWPPRGLEVFSSLPTAGWFRSWAWVGSAGRVEFLPRLPCSWVR